METIFFLKKLVGNVFPQTNWLISYRHIFVIHVFSKSFKTDLTTQKMKFSIKDFFSKCDQIRSFLWIWSHLLKTSYIENFISCTVSIATNRQPPLPATQSKLECIMNVFYTNILHLSISGCKSPKCDYVTSAVDFNHIDQFQSPVKIKNN